MPRVNSLRLAGVLAPNSSVPGRGQLITALVKESGDGDVGPPGWVLGRFARRMTGGVAPPFMRDSAAAIEPADQNGVQRLWQQIIDNRGRSLGDPSRLR